MSSLSAKRISQHFSYDILVLTVEDRMPEGSLAFSLQRSLSLVTAVDWDSTSRWYCSLLVLLAVVTGSARVLSATAVHIFALVRLSPRYALFYG